MKKIIFLIFILYSCSENDMDFNSEFADVNDYVIDNIDYLW